MKIAEIMSYLGEDWTGFEEVMRSNLASDVALLQSINDGMLASSGKKLRPMICLLVARALGVPNLDSLRYAAACELLHNATKYRTSPHYRIRLIFQKKVYGHDLYAAFRLHRHYHVLISHCSFCYSERLWNGRTRNVCVEDGHLFPGSCRS